jgi:type I restriction enzyme S subunit
MAREVKTTATPRLRFPEFRGAEGWVEKDLREISASVFDGTHQTPKYTNEGVPFFSVENVVSGAANKFISHAAYEIATKKNKPEKDDLLVTRIGKIGFSQVVTWDGEFSIYVTLAVVKKSTFFNSHYLHYFIQSGRYQLEILSKSLLNAVPCKINMDSLRATRVLLPELPEQQKIADCLTSLDEVIAAQGRKVEALKVHKRGLMQQLFPREGETLPRRRFPEFRGRPEWEESSLQSVGAMRAGTFVSASAIADARDADSFPCYGGNGLRGFTKTFTHSGKYALIGRQGALCGNAFLVDGKFHATEHALVVTTAKNINVTWLYYMLGFLNLNQYSIGQAQPGLSVTVLEKVPIAIPKTEREQQRIADCLSSLDAQIAAESEKLDALKTHKKGLMQQLFPSPEGD